jgi:alkylation response protein AidB-like acyl-CoA dehydrogenase
MNADPIPRFVDANLAHTLARSAASSERARQLDPACAAAMKEAGLFRILVPRRAGGEELDFRAMAQCVRETAYHNAAAAWVLMVSTAHDWILGSFPEAVQDEVHAEGPDSVFPGSLANTGEMIPVDGGWRLTGRFPFASGATHGEWALLGTFVAAEGRPVPHHVVVPCQELRIDDDWHTVGLRGTGSVTLVAEDTFVPEHRGVRSGRLFRGQCEAAQHHATTVYKTPIVPGLSTHLAAALIGMARPALDDTIERTREQIDKYTGQKKADRPGLQMRLAEADAELCCADAMLEDTIRLLEHAAGGNDDIPLRARARYQASYACELSRRAVERLMTGSGARAAFDGSRLGQAFRDVTMGKTHAMIDLDGGAQVFGRTLLGLDTGGAPL